MAAQDKNWVSYGFYISYVGGDKMFCRKFADDESAWAAALIFFHKEFASPVKVTSFFFDRGVNHRPVRRKESDERGFGDIFHPFHDISHCTF